MTSQTVSMRRSNNTNKLSPQELPLFHRLNSQSSNNTNKLSPQEQPFCIMFWNECSNNTNKLSPQERQFFKAKGWTVQIIQINLVLKNILMHFFILIMFK